MLAIPGREIVIEVPQPEPIVMELPTTKYSAIDSCHYENCLTAYGIRPTPQSVACPRDWELGTKLEIDGKTYYCHDRYNKNLSDRIDIWTGWDKEAHELAIEYGVKVKQIKIIK